MLIRSGECEPFITKDTSEIREFVNPRITPGCRNLSLAQATLAPGASTHAHRHPQSEEIYYFLSGAAEMTLEGQRAQAGAGDIVFIPAGAVHECRNIGSDPLVFLCHCAPAYSHDDTELL